MKLSIPHNLSIRKHVTACDLQRFVAKVVVDPKTGCWMWTGTKDKHGYGQFWWRDKMHWAHRWALAAFKVRRIPRGYDADHQDKCRRPSCVAPYHIHAIARGEHGRRHAVEQHATEQSTKARVE